MRVFLTKNIGEFQILTSEILKTKPKLTTSLVLNNRDQCLCLGPGVYAPEFWFWPIIKESKVFQFESTEGKNI